MRNLTLNSIEYMKKKIEIQRYKLFTHDKNLLGIDLLCMKDLERHLENINSELRDNFGEEYKITNYIKFSDTFFSLHTNLPYILFLEKTYGVKISLDSSVRDVYCKIYPDDRNGKNIREHLTFNDIWDGLVQKKYIYLHPYSEKRILEILSPLKRCENNEIWYLWNNGEISLW